MPRYPIDRLPDSEQLLDDLIEHHRTPDSNTADGLHAWIQAQLDHGLMTNLDPSDALVAARVLPGFRDCVTVADLQAPLRAERDRLAAGGENAKDVLLRWHDAMLAHAAGCIAAHGPEELPGDLRA